MESKIQASPPYQAAPGVYMGSTQTTPGVVVSPPPAAVPMSDITYTTVSDPEIGGSKRQTVVRPGNLGDNPDFIDCQHCRSCQQTKVEKISSSQTLLVAVFCGVFTCCCCVPYAFHWYYDTDHYCTGCGKVAHKPHDGQTQAVEPEEQHYSQYA